MIWSRDFAALTRVEQTLFFSKNLPGFSFAEGGFAPLKWLIAIGPGALSGLLPAIFWLRRKS